MFAVCKVLDMALSPLRVQFVTEDPEPEKFLKISRLFRYFDDFVVQLILSVPFIWSHFFLSFSYRSHLML